MSKNKKKAKLQKKQSRLSNKKIGIMVAVAAVVVIAAGAMVYWQKNRAVDEKLDYDPAKYVKIGEYKGVQVSLEVTDEDILNAIRYHTTGRAGMSLLEKIIFIADYIEPNREKFDGLEEARRLAYLDLDMAMKYILESTIAFVKERGRLLHPLSLEALEYYKHCVEKEETE